VLLILLSHTPLCALQINKEKKLIFVSLAKIDVGVGVKIIRL
jgi:hypothetical protein